MDAEMAVNCLRKFKHPVLGRNIQIDEVWANEIANFIQQQEKYAELGRAAVEIKGTICVSSNFDNYWCPGHCKNYRFCKLRAERGGK